MVDNPFFVQPANALQALMSGVQGYEQGSKLRIKNNRQNTLANAGGDLSAAAKQLIADGDIEGANSIATVAKNLAAPEQTDLIRNLSAENAARAAKGLPALSPLEYETSKAKASAANTTVNNQINSAVNPVLQGVSNRFNESVEAANSARSQIEALHEARQALDDGAITGAFADKRLLATKVGSIFGIPQDQVANTETFRSAIGTQVMAKAKALGANPSNTDRDYLEKIAAGQIELSEKTIRNVLDMQERWARDSIKRTNRTSQNLLKAYPNELGRVRDLLSVEEPDDYPTYISKRGASNSGALQGGAPKGYPNARRGNDGNFYVPDPNRPGKYLQVR